ncbi:AAA family ATPase [Colletotrichum kahawae]|uniref:AAA family ATPase n=1 Tax=Colletotrichum kahawae TaxID=34407 RepID=A0AAD9YUA6_COLKA|nr:AAA family ATPase [Colletotrichum kahawae]
MSDTEEDLQAVSAKASPSTPPIKDSPFYWNTEIARSRRKKWGWTISVWSIVFDGQFSDSNQEVKLTLETYHTDEEIKIGTLEIVPIRFLEPSIKARLINRGHTFWRCREKRLVTYSTATSDDSNVAGQRFMVDYQTYKKLHPDSQRPVDNNRNVKETGQNFHRSANPPDEPASLLFPSQTVGFNLRRKAWEDIKIDLIEDVQWNKDAFSQHLVADDDTKELIEALVTSQLALENSTDVIENKEKGLIMLLHGSPGTGKTFTAEGVAEMAEKPLYPVTCGDLATKPENVEKYLESVFHLGRLWGCVVLLDEAEVFLEQRQLVDLERNALVSVFLRALEYYDGILTSNRVGTFDEAFKSRIQLAIHYEPLKKAQRKQVWKNSFNRLERLEEGNIDFEDIRTYYDDLSIFKMDGRQIRNSITTARQLAQFKGKKMTYSHLKHAIKVSGKFDEYLANLRNGLGDEEIAKEEGMR